MPRHGRVLDRVDLQGGKWHLHFLSRETNQKHRFVLKRPNGSYPDPSPAGEDEALGLAQERYIELRTRTDRGEVVKVLTIGGMVERFLEREQKRISNRPHEGITAARFRLIRNQCRHFLNYCSDGRGGSTKQIHLARRGFLNRYQHWREETSNELDKQGRKLPRPTTLNAEFSTIKRMWREVALAQGFVTRDQLPEIPYAKTGKDHSYRRSALTAGEWVQLERSARLYWIEGKSRYDEFGEPLGYHLITMGENKGKESEKPITRSTLYEVNRRKGTKQYRRATHQQIHREMLYLAMRISMESGIRISSLRQMFWHHISEHKTLSKEERKIWCVVEVPTENTKTGRWYELGAPITAHLERPKRITRPKNKNGLLFLNQSTGKPLSSRIWRDNLLEMLVGAGLATWSSDDCNNQHKAEVKSGKILTWYSLRHTWITFALVT